MRLISSSKGEHEGKTYLGEIYEVENPEDFSPIKQIQAVAFTEIDMKTHVVFFKHIKGHIGNPGGGIEQGETLEDALRREIMEEINCEMVDSGLTGILEKVWEEGNPKTTMYHARAWAKVELNDGEVNDPCGKAIERVVVPVAKAVEELGWGEKGKVLLDRAYEEYCKACK